MIAGEFFAGIGLVRLALENQGWKVAYANDIDEGKATMYRANWPDERSHLVVGDIHQLAAHEIPRCDLFTASFPCNDLSIAGRREGLGGKESSAFWGLIRILQELEDRAPPVVLIENVVGFLMQRQGKDLETALLAFNRLGYSVDAFILNAKRWTPQSRARLFLVATRGLDDEASSCVLETDSRPKALVDFMNSHSHIDWRLRALPPLPRSDVRLKDIVEDLPDDDEMWWAPERTSYFMNQLSERHEADAQAMSNANEWSYATAFRRVRAGKSMAELRTDGIAGCLRTQRGGSGRQILLKAGFGKRQVRLLSARECARLQGVPDSYIINVRLNQALFGFGDAVCVPAIEWIVKNYVTPVSLQIKRRAMTSDFRWGANAACEEKVTEEAG